MQTFQSGAAITKFGKGKKTLSISRTPLNALNFFCANPGVSSNPTEGEENLTAEEWKVTLVNTLKYLKKIGKLTFLKKFEFI